MGIGRCTCSTRNKQGKEEKNFMAATLDSAIRKGFLEEAAFNLDL